MNTGQWLTRATIWVALSLLVAGEIVSAGGRSGQRRGSIRWLQTLGCAAFFGHVGCAFAFYHHWSHSAAYAETARQTAAVVGWNWGGGLYFNYAFGLVWLGEVIISWTGSAGLLQHPNWVTWVVRSFVMLMVFNGAVVFVNTSLRWLGLLLCLSLASCWSKRL